MQGQDIHMRIAKGREWDNIDRKTAFAFQRETHGQIDITNDYLTAVKSWAVSFLNFGPSWSGAKPFSDGRYSL